MKTVNKNEFLERFYTSTMKIFVRMRFLFDQEICILHIWVILYLSIPTISLYCDKYFTYYEEYGENFFNVTCSDISKNTQHVLENITINNEISLTIIDSSLENVTPDLFRNVRNIKILSILNSHFSFDRKQSIFYDLDSLETLEIINTSFSIENSTLNGLKSLKNIKFTNNSLTVIPSSSLDQLDNLERLEISENLLTDVKNIPLCGLRKLKLLNLSSNLLTNLDHFYFDCHTYKKRVDVNMADVPSLQSDIFDSTFYNITTGSHDVTDLDLSKNQIKSLGISLSNLDKLRFLNLGYNSLVKVTNVQFQTLVSLGKLRLNNNKLQHLNSKIFDNKPRLVFVDLSHNYLNEITVFNVSNLQYLYIEHNNLVSVSFKSLPSLKYVSLEQNDLAELTPDEFQDLPKLSRMNLSGNKITLTKGLFKNIPSLTFLDLSNNSITNITENVFMGLKNLESLDLSNNQLSHLSGNPFVDIENLEYLNVSFNLIESLSYLSLEPLSNLKTLDIANNKLKFIEYDVILSNLPGLTNINIKYNILTCDNLKKLIVFLKKRNISYTHNEYINLENINQNIAGIPCQSANRSLLVAVSSKNNGRIALFVIGVCLVIVLVSVIAGIMSYKFYIYLKRRKYRADEFELVDE
ncbi:leucine-rich repeats and immunoglobulin-like domains protein 3 [Sitophilus oryzae]|uniref:Leucine-rich repeats and immunoglobulin-like domains protein 3 n=1 Tax=Sitophilus oryzae TaxID=7048 RepID=A0A6J2XGG6_SITOR|nr:leucine-rich repeats and immunoglobulin-like domains protein 3 [Sitophilus oryzae]